ncbi:hypothetical protein [Lacipirellula limnantheis]|uniref:Uncharacterized protein n=1 Tax=Lacipirellula limnantheis TaxID=2528024 RepID=A0A517TTB9_9BACT|nr:hypothetical protein [Lacipirellula limnantheis]QDT71619.1 hypothetical protein I41_07790 [Lacipirellula limnantheis]
MTSDQDPIRFSMRGMLLAVTAACALLGLLQWLLPEDLPVWSRTWTSALILALACYAVWICRRSKRPCRPPSDFVTVRIDAKWKRRVKSPYIMGPVAALTGVSVTFAPFFLFTRGPIGELEAWEWAGVAASFLMIYLVPGSYMRLASEVMAELMREDKAAGDSGAERSISAPGSAGG